jgi:hypothetical protein
MGNIDKRLSEAERRAERLKRADTAPGNLIVIDTSEADQPQRRAAHDASGRPIKVLAGIDLAAL